MTHLINITIDLKYSKWLIILSYRKTPNKKKRKKNLSGSCSLVSWFIFVQIKIIWLSKVNVRTSTWVLQNRQQKHHHKAGSQVSLKHFSYLFIYLFIVSINKVYNNALVERCLVAYLGTTNLLILSNSSMCP